MAATRLPRMSRPLGFKPMETLISNYDVSSSSRPRSLMCINKVGLSSDISPIERKPVVVKAASDCTVILEPSVVDKGADLGFLLKFVGDALSHWRKFFGEQRSWGLQIQMFVERAIIDCRLFTLMAIGGSLICSLLCFVEGCLLVMGSYVQNFHALKQISDQGQGILVLIEAIDMFIMGTAMLVFASALYAMFLGQNNIIGKGNDSNLKMASWMGRGSAMEAKSKIGHAVMLILQVQVLDKFKSIAVSNGLDLACFAGAIFLSSASNFLLSRTNNHHTLFPLP